jgi:hypothetical protein
LGKSGRLTLALLAAPEAGLTMSPTPAELVACGALPLIKGSQTKSFVRRLYQNERQTHNNEQGVAAALAAGGKERTVGVLSRLMQRLLQCGELTGAQKEMFHDAYVTSGFESVGKAYESLHEQVSAAGGELHVNSIATPKTQAFCSGADLNSVKNMFRYPGNGKAAVPFPTTMTATEGSGQGGEVSTSEYRRGILNALSEIQNTRQQRAPAAPAAPQQLSPSTLGARSKLMKDLAADEEDDEKKQEYLDAAQKLREKALQLSLAGMP